MKIKKVLKGSLIGLAVLGMIGGSINPATVNAHRRYRVHKHLRRRHLRRNKRTRRFGRLRKYRKHHRTRYVWTRRRRNRNRRRSYRSGKRGHTWKLYRKNSSLAGTFHNYKEYKSAKGWLDWFNRFEAKSKRSRKHKRINRGRITRKSIKKNYQSHNTNDQNSSSQNPSEADVAQTLAEFKQQTLTDLNKDRQANGVGPLTETPELDQFANERAKQLQTNYNHISGGIDNGNYAENIDETEAGQTDLTDGTPVTNNNGYDMANNEENELMNHDIPNWGHRRNILDPSLTQVGIGTIYDPTDVEGFPYKLAEDFK